MMIRKALRELDNVFIIKSEGNDLDDVYKKYQDQ